MSGTQQPPMLSTVIGAPMISVLSLVLSGLALLAALWMYLHDGTSAPLVGAIGLLLGKGSTVVDYWLGSSSGSKDKSAVIATKLEEVIPKLPAGL